MSQPSIFWWQKYGTLAQMAQAAVALLGFVATASVTPPDCKLGKT
jgi:hypothetical protein